jgi:uncharacterized protein
VNVLLNLQELEVRPVRFDVAIPAGEIEFDSELKQASPLVAKGVAELLNSLGEVKIAGSLTVSAEAPCDRCLETARLAIEKEFDLRYFPSDQFAEGGGEEVIAKEASEIAYYKGDRLDLNEILHEVVLLALPMQVVCSEACKGICATCGKNRNVHECRCEARAVDDRWSKLKALRTELSTGQ